MLKNIPDCISPALMAVMMEMGHGDELVLADRDFPAYTMGKKVIRADGITLARLLDAVLAFFPLDTFVQCPAAMMSPVEKAPEEWKVLQNIIGARHAEFTGVEYLERFVFYERTRNAYAIVMTSEPDGNIILKKGVV